MFSLPSFLQMDFKSSLLPEFCTKLNYNHQGFCSSVYLNVSIKQKFFISSVTV